jgi:hypothetical protein
MQIHVTVTLTIHDDGRIEAGTPRWTTTGVDQSLGAVVQQVFSEARKALPNDPAQEVVTTTVRNDAADVTKAIGLAAIVGLERAELDAGLRQVTAKRCVEVLTWIRTRKQKETVRSVSALFWAVVGKS